MSWTLDTRYRDSTNMELRISPDGRAPGQDTFALLQVRLKMLLGTIKVLSEPVISLRVSGSGVLPRTVRIGAGSEAA